MYTNIKKYALGTENQHSLNQVNGNIYLPLYIAEHVVIVSSIVKDYNGILQFHCDCYNKHGGL